MCVIVSRGMQDLAPGKDLALVWDVTQHCPVAPNKALLYSCVVVEMIVFEGNSQGDTYIYISIVSFQY